MNKDILDHVAICTDSIEKSVQWYTENFTFEIFNIPFNRFFNTVSANSYMI